MSSLTVHRKKIYGIIFNVCYRHSSKYRDNIKYYFTLIHKVRIDVIVIKKLQNNTFTKWHYSMNRSVSSIIGTMKGDIERGDWVRIYTGNPQINFGY